MNGNEMIVRRYIDEVVNENRVSVIDEIFDADYINHTPNGDLRGRDAMKGFIARVRATVHDICAAHDRVTVRLTLTGTYHGEILGVAYQGRPIALPEIQIYRLADAQIAERWFIADWRSVWQRFGAIR